MLCFLFVLRGMELKVLVYGECECFRHADVVCLCLVCILWQFSMLRSA